MNKVIVAATTEPDGALLCHTNPRSIRRHHLTRVKQNRQFYWGAGTEGKRLTGRALGKVANAPAVAAGPRYGKPRKHVPTIQEIRQHQHALHEFTLSSQETI